MNSNLTNQILLKEESEDFLKDFNMLKENIYPENFNPWNLETLELNMEMRIKNLKHFFIFKNLKEMNIIMCEIELTGLENLDFLRELRIVNCGIKEIEKCFTKLKNLEILSLAENSIKEIRNLHNCINLRKVCLYSNSISKIEFLQDCTLLEELDLSDNLISKVENLDSLIYLQSLNLSANSIDNFSNLNNIKFIYNLKELKFNDSNFGMNPICELDLYREYILKIKPDLEILDDIIIKQSDNTNKDDLFYINKIARKLKSEYKNFVNNLNQESKLIENLQEKIRFKYLEKSELLKNEEKIKNLQKQTNEFKMKENEKEIYKTIIENKNNLLLDSNIINNELKNKSKQIEKYFETLLQVNKTLNYNCFKILAKNKTEYKELKILDTEFIYEFYKKIFPPTYSDLFKAYPMIILKFKHKENYSNIDSIESFIEFNNYEYLYLTESSCQDYNNFENLLISLLKGDRDSIYFKNSNNEKFSKLTENTILQKLDNFLLILTNSSNEIKYIIYFFSILDSKFVLSDSEKLNLDENDIFSELMNSNVKNSQIKEIYDKVNENEKLDQLIQEKENTISQLEKETYLLLDDIMSIIN